MARAANMAILTAESGLTRYLEQIRRFPLLERQDEYMFAKRWREHGDATPRTGSSPAICAWWPRLPWDIAATACPSPK